MSTTVTYLFDPLCGWCYGASPVLHKLSQHNSFALVLAPTGLFAGTGGRTLDAAFADYAWSNDQRIEKLTGQRFTQAYRTQVLDQVGSRFDSVNATLALTAVAQTAPERELDTLTAIQEARYLNGLDITTMPVLDPLLRDLGLAASADRLAENSPELRQAGDARTQRAQMLMQAHGAQGVPALVLTNEHGSRLLSANTLYGEFDSLVSHLGSD
jgi:putative protein-disulfide isomerase